MEKIYTRIKRLLPVATNERTKNTPKIETFRFLLLNCFVLVEIWSLSINFHTVQFSARWEETLALYELLPEGPLQPSSSQTVQDSHTTTAILAMMQVV